MSLSGEVKEFGSDNTMNKYLRNEQLDVLNIDDFKVFEFVTNDTINEEDLLKTILDSGLKEEMFAITLQFAVIGFGGRQYNQYKYKGEIKEIQKFFKDAGIRYNNTLNDKLDSQTLTPRRLLRIFRKQVKNYLDSNEGVTTYLFNKYSERLNQYRSICFQGAEHLIQNEDEAVFFYKTCYRLDKTLMKRRQDHGICLRIERIFLARGIHLDFELVKSEVDIEI